MQKILPLLILFFCFQFNLLAQSNKDLSSDDYYKMAKIEAQQKQNYAKAIGYCKQGIALSPNNYDIHELLGKCYLEIKNYDSARYELKKVTDKNPRNVDARHYLINVEYTTGRYSSAICYVNELLEIRPYSKSLWLKKISIYNDMGNKLEAKRAITRLYTIFPNDSAVARQYRNFMQEEAEGYYKQGNFTKSKELLEKVVENNSRDIKSIQQLVNTQLKSGKKTEALNTIELGLANAPYDPLLIEKKIGILQEQGNYPDAIAFAEQTAKKYPSARLRTIINDLKIESARYYNNSDPYVLYQKVYASNPGNQEAFNYLLSNAITKGYYSDAEEYIRTALKRNPNDKNTLLKQLSLLEAQGKTLDAQKLTEKLATKFGSDAEIQDRYSTILLQQAKGYFQDQLYPQAEQAFEKVSRFPDLRSTANEYLYSIQLAQKNYPEALKRINKLIASNPRNEDYTFKKSSLLEEMGQYDEALKITKQLTARNPSNTRFKDVYTNQSTPYIKQLIESEKYDSALNVINTLLDNDPTNSLAYNYGININATKKDYPAGIEFCDRAMQYYPESRDFKLKKADLFQSMKEYENAATVLEDLQTKFPYNEKIQSALGEAYYLQGRKYENDFYMDSAIYFYSKAQAILPKDTNSLYRLINLTIDIEQYDTAQGFINKGLANYPENEHLLYKKGVLYELQEKYDSAYLYIKKVEPPFSNPNYTNYLNYLLSKSYKNQAGVYFTRSFFDSTQLKSSIATFEYQRFQKQNTYIYRLNYAARPLGTGVQHELEWFHKFNKKFYTQSNIAFARKIAFPKFKVGISGFKTLPYEWEVEVGGRYIIQRNDTKTVSLVGGVAKSWDEVWLNFRGFVITDFNKVYNTLLLQSRYYFNYKNDYLMIMGSLGTPPEDKTLDFQLNTFLNYTTRMVGAGVQHKIKHRSTVGLLANWYNYQLKENYYYNQYNVQLVLLTKF